MPSNEWLVGFTTGFATTGLVSYVIFRKQKRDAEDQLSTLRLDNRQMLILAKRHEQQGYNTLAGLGESTGNILTEIRKLAEKFEQGHKGAQEAERESDYSALDENIAKYTKAAEQYADLKFLELQKSVPSTGVLSIDELRKMHASLFPNSYEIAGFLRRQQVWIRDSSTSVSDIGDTIFKPPPPQDVSRLLSDLLKKWNKQLPGLSQSTEQVKIAALAEFHHQFARIHPFIDGNGRLGRLILAQQIKALFGKTVSTAFKDMKIYYLSLKVADSGDPGPLNKVISELVS